MTSNDYILGPCATEDSSMCFWDATAQGNGEGISYFSDDSSTTYMSVPEGQHVTSVVVSKDGPHAEDGSAQYTVNYAHTATSDPVEATPTPSAHSVDLTLPIVLVASALIISITGIIAAYRSRVTTW